MPTELCRLDLSIFCPVEQRPVDFVYVRMEGASDLAWCHGCFLVREVVDDLCCPKTGQRAQLRR